jgi:hypothetical protein
MKTFANAISEINRLVQSFIRPKKVNEWHRVSIAECLCKVREVLAGRDASDCLYRGEASLYPATRSSYYRLFSESNRFTDDQARAVKERLLTIAQMLEVVGLGRPGFSRPEDALKHAPPMRLEDVNEVIYSLMQHYHLPTPFIDLTTDIEVAAAFASDGARKGDKLQTRRGVIYLVSRKGLEGLGFVLFDPMDSIATRPVKQRAVALFLERDTNFQALPKHVLARFEFEDTSGAIARYDNPHIYDAEGDRIAQQVAMLAYRCAYEDLASSDPSHVRVTEFFSQIAYSLADAGAVPRA